MTNIPDRPVEILLVENDEGDVYLTLQALMESHLRSYLNVVKDGIEAMAYLRREEPYWDATRPDVVLLDLNMPRKNGLETLAEIRQDNTLKDLPVILLTTSKAIEDKTKADQLGATRFVTKPVVWSDFIRMIKILEHFWVGFLRSKGSHN